MAVFKNVKKEDAEKLKSLGFVPSEPKTIHEMIRYLKDDVTAIFYNSGKLFLQGKEDKVERAVNQLVKKKIGEEVKKISFRKQSGWMIGSDESLKGDTFGGLVVAAVKADDAIRTKLRELGVADSKSLKDQEVTRLSFEIKKLAPCEVYSILPEDYNKGEGVTDMLNKFHSKVAKELGGGKHAVDEYPGCKVGDIIETKAEQKFIEVAAASILARASALQQMDYLSMEAGFRVPKGSTHVQLGLHELKEREKDFKKFVKMHFKNVEEFLKNPQ